MIIITKKIHRARLVAGFVMLALTIGFVGAGLGLARDIQRTEVLSVPQENTKGIKSNEDRIAFLESLGWMVAEEAASMEDVLIPETFDASYDEYLALQESQGFDLTAYAGKTVKRYTYQVTNYPGLQENIWASLLIYKKQVIGGEVFCNQGDGFTQGLDYPTGEKKNEQATASQDVSDSSTDKTAELGT